MYSSVHNYYNITKENVFENWVYNNSLIHKLKVFHAEKSFSSFPNLSLNCFACRSQSAAFSDRINYSNDSVSFLATKYIPESFRISSSSRHFCE